MKKNKYLSIRSKLIPIFIALSIVPVVIVSAFTINQSSKLVKSKVDNLTLQVAQEKASYVDGFINRMINESNIVASNQNVIKKDQAQLMDLLKSVKESDSGIMNAYIGTKDKDMFLYPIQNLPKDYDPTSRPWYTDAIAAGGKPIITAPYKDASSGKPEISIAKAMKLADGEDAVVAIDVDLTSLTGQITKTKVGNTGYAALLTSDGIIIAHPDGKQIMVNAAQKYDWGKYAVENKNGNETYKEGKSNMDMGFAQSELTGWIATASIPQSEYANELNKSRGLTLLFVLILGVLAILIGYASVNYIAKPISKLSALMEVSGKGDLTIEAEVTRKDEIGLIQRGFNEMQNARRSMIVNIINSSRELLDASKKMMELSSKSVGAVKTITGSMEYIASSSQTNAASLEEANAGIEEMAANSQTVAAAIQKVSDNSEATVEITESGQTSVGLAVNSMSKIKATSENVTRVVGELLNASNQIDVIVNTITSISAQTNLLALNAAIEAARAGEAGRGFSVVAEEVRKLAEESSNAAKNIGSLIQDIQSKIQNAVATTGEEMHIVEEGTENALQAKEALNKIIESIRSLDKYIEEVSAAAEEQSASTQEMASVIGSISQSFDDTVKNTDNVSEATLMQNKVIVSLEESVKEVKAIAEELSSQVQKFKI